MSLRLPSVPGAARAFRVHLSCRLPRPSARLRWPGAALLVVVATWVGTATVRMHPVESPWRPWVGPSRRVPDLPRPWPDSIGANAARSVEAAFQPGATLATELRSSGLPEDTINDVVEAASTAIDLRRILPGQPYRLYFDEQDRLLALRYPVDRRTAWFVAREEDGWQTSKVVLPLRIEPAFVSATVSGTLEGALVPHAQTRRDVHELVVKIADIFGWDVDFNYDLQPGDRLDMVVEERFVEGEFIGYGDVLAAEFRVRGRVIPAVRFRDSDANRSYFTPDGQSLRRAFLRSPVKYDRISSRFSLRRVHPVTGVPRAHHGVDYVASPGTPVQATADGVVAETAYGGEPGRYVKIRHGGSYSSIYMHLSRYAEGIKPGVAVHQGDVIGYVGRTGNATGYHLHYGLLQGSRYVDPLVLQFPAADPVPDSGWMAFVDQRDRWLQILRNGQSRVDVQVAGAGGL